MSRTTTNSLFIGLCVTGAITCASVLLFLLAMIFWKGLTVFDAAFVLTPSRRFGAGGGVLYQIFGSVLITVVAGLIAFPIALGTAIFKSEYISNPVWQRVTDHLLYGLNGVPSILFGLFGLIVFVHGLGTGVSWFVGSIVLAMMMIPTIVFSAHQTFKQIPDVYRASARSLGLTRWTVIWRVILPQGIHGAITGLFLGLARAIGETAPIMFIATAYSGAGIPDSLFDPVPTLPTHILTLAQQAVDPEALRSAWGASLVLISLVLIFSLCAFLTRFNTR